MLENREAVAVNKALIQAAKRGDIEAVSQLLNTDEVDPNAQNSDGHTAFMLAAIYRHAPIVRLLVEKGANPNARDKEGDTALHHSISNPNSHHMVPLLLEVGADPRVQNNRGNTALHMTVLVENRAPLLKLLLDHPTKSIDIQSDGSQQTALISAVQAENPRAVKMLVDAMADMSLQDQSGKTATQHAIDELAPYTSTLTSSDYRGVTVLQRTIRPAASQPMREILEYLEGAEQGRSLKNRAVGGKIVRGFFHTPPNRIAANARPAEILPPEIVSTVLEYHADDYRRPPDGGSGGARVEELGTEKGCCIS